MNPKGLLIYDSPNGSRQVFDTLQCVHCNGHFPVKPGSRQRRGFCVNCMGPLCGAPQCGVCIPFEKKLELIEQR